MPMAPARHDFRWFLRTVRVLPVVAVAALAGGVIGGFSIFAINLALTAPPNRGVPPEPGSKLAGETAGNAAVPSPTPIRTFDAALPAPRPADRASAHQVPATQPPITQVDASPVNVVASARPSASLTSSDLPAVAASAVVAGEKISPAQPMSEAMASPPEENSAPLAVAHPRANETAGLTPQAPSAASPQIAVIPPQTTATPQDQTEPQAVKTETVLKPAAGQGAKRRVAVKRPPMTSDEQARDVSSGEPRRLYDSYGRQDYGDRDRENAAPDSDRGDGFPAQPPPLLPFFGLFGGSDRD